MGPYRATPSCASTCTSERVVKFVRPKPIELAPREEDKRLLLVDRLVDLLEAG